VRAPDAEGGTIVATSIESTVRPAEALREPAAPRRGGTLRVNLAVDTDATDPALAAHTTSVQLAYATHAKLVNHRDAPGAEGLELVPEVARALPEISDDGRTYVFTLRTGADAYRFDTGEVVIAAHFAHALNRVLRPRMQSPWQPFIDCIVGADDVANERAATAAGIRVVAEDRLEIELTRRTPDFLTRLALPFCSPIPLHNPDDPDGVDALASAGPYHVVERTRGKSITLRRNPHYTHHRPAYVDAIEYRVGFTPEDSLDLVERGEADFLADGIPPDHEGRLGSEYGVNVRRFLVTPSVQLDYIALNTARPLFSDPRVRRAVNFAVNRPEHVSLRGEHSGIPADHILPPLMPGYRDERLYPLDGPDFERARGELPDDFRSGTCAFYCRDNLAAPHIARGFRECLAQLDIDVDIHLLPDAVLHKRAGTKGEPFDCLLTGWWAEYPDPFVFFNQLLHGGAIRPSNNLNFAYFDHPEYNAKMDFAAQLSAPDRYAAYGELDVDLMRNAPPWIPCNNRTARDFMSDRVRNGFHHSIHGLDFVALWLDDAPEPA
jgi:peptide/nickel transport system substrate-binding protein